MPARLGPVAALAQLSKKDARPSALEDATCSIASRVRELSSSGVSEQQDVNWLVAVVKAATCKLGSPGAPAELLTTSCDACGCLLEACDAGAMPTDAALAAYGLMRKLVGMGAFDAGLPQGRLLQAALAAAVARGNAPASLLDMYVGSTLNLVICMAEGSGVVGAQVGPWAAVLVGAVNRAKPGPLLAARGNKTHTIARHHRTRRRCRPWAQQCWRSCITSGGGGAAQRVTSPGSAPGAC